jgi:hypothetical protein
MAPVFSLCIHQQFIDIPIDTHQAWAAFITSFASSYKIEQRSRLLLLVLCKKHKKPNTDFVHLSTRKSYITKLDSVSDI